MNLVLPSVLSQLVSVATTACPTPAVVIDGPALSEGREKLAIFIGASADESDQVQAATSDVEWAAIGRVYDEQALISCAISAWSGNSGFSATRTAAYGALSAILTAIATDPGLANTCVWVKALPGITLTQTRDEEGVRVVIDFTISYQARP